MGPLIKEFYTPRDLAELFEVTPRTIARLVERGELPAVHVGRNVRFHREDVEAYIDRQRVAPADAPARSANGAAAGRATELRVWSRPSPIGDLTVVESDAGVARILFEDEDRDSAMARLERIFQLRPKPGKASEDVRRELDAYFAGELTSFHFPVDLSLLSPARQAYVRQLLDVAYGETTTYTAIAKRAGRPRAARAAGQAIGKNPVPIVVPCHRVIASDGSLGGYSGGLDRKRFLLRLEGHDDLVGGWVASHRAARGLAS